MAKRYTKIGKAKLDRIDGHQIHAATRVQTGYWCVIFFPLEPATRTIPSP